MGKMKNINSPQPERFPHGIGNPAAAVAVLGAEGKGREGSAEQEPQQQK